MSSVKPFVIATVLALAACTTGLRASGSAPSSSIPAAYYGAYNRTQIGCSGVRSAADAELEISASRMRYALVEEPFVGTVTSVRNLPVQGIVATARSLTPRQQPEIKLHLIVDPKSNKLHVQRNSRRPGQREPGGMSAPIFMVRCL
jgi:hypothetical protein